MDSDINKKKTVHFLIACVLFIILLFELINFKDILTHPYMMLLNSILATGCIVNLISYKGLIIMKTEIVSITLTDREAHIKMGIQVKEHKAKFLYFANDKFYYEVIIKV